MNTIERDFYKKLSSLCEKDKLRLLVAFSGGCDSLALLVLSVKTLGAEKVFPVYVNHNLRNPEELEKEIALNEVNCRKIGVKSTVCTLVKGQVLALAKERKGGVEEAARLLRYQKLEEVRLSYNCAFVATAHHRQDQLETIAMRLSKGSPVSSLCGIAPQDEARHLIRPLLEFDRTALENYLKEQGFTWSEDSTNQDSNYARNKLRNVTLPKARELWPDCDKSLLALSQEAKKLVQGRPETKTSISVETFKALNPTQKTLALFDLYNRVLQDEQMPMTLVMRVCDAVEKALQNPQGSYNGQKISANGVDILISNEIKIQKQIQPNKTQNNSFEVEFDPQQDQKIELPWGLIFSSGQFAEPYKTEKSLRLEAKNFAGKPKLRFAKIGDCIKLKGGKKMVLRLLQDMKVPQNLRFRVPVLVDDDGLCAVFGSAQGGIDRICVKFRSSLAPNSFTLYIVSNEVSQTSKG